MEVSTIISIIVMLLLLYVVMNYVFKDANTMTGLISGTTQQNIAGNTLAKNTNGSNTNFAYSIWYYINDWNYRYSNPKILFVRGTKPSTDTTGTTGTGTDSNTGIHPKDYLTVAFTPIKNDLMINLKDKRGISNYCIINNIPIQKWVNITISVYQRSLDVYLDGKLVKTHILNNVVSIPSNSNISITPDQGFDGWTSKFEFYPYGLNPQQVWDIYTKGYGASWLSNLFGKYKLKIAFLENGTEDSSITIF